MSSCTLDVNACLMNSPYSTPHLNVCTLSICDVGGPPVPCRLSWELVSVASGRGLATRCPESYGSCQREGDDSNLFVAYEHFQLCSIAVYLSKSDRYDWRGFLR